MHLLVPRVVCQSHSLASMIFCMATSLSPLFVRESDYPANVLSEKCLFGKAIVRETSVNPFQQGRLHYEVQHIPTH